MASFLEGQAKKTEVIVGRLCCAILSSGHVAPKHKPQTYFFKLIKTSISALSKKYANTSITDRVQLL